MKRRTFVAAAMSLLGIYKTKEEVKTSDSSHYFDWVGDIPFTTDPQYAGKLFWGGHNHIYCNGVECHRARRFVTGPNGWVEVLKLNDTGHIFTEVRRMDTGELAQPQPQWQCWNFERILEDGHLCTKLSPAYYEALAVHRFYGKVTYASDRNSS